MVKIIITLLKESKYRNVFILIIALILLAVSITVSYSYFTYVDNTPDIVATTDCFELSYTDRDTINLVNAIPMSDEEANNLTPYKFTIKNVCNQAASYDVTLEDLETTDIDLNYIKYKLDDMEPSILGSIDVNDSKVLSESRNSRTLTSAILMPGEEISYELKTWIEENASKEVSADKTLEFKVVVISTLNKHPYKIVALNTTGGYLDSYEVNIVDGRVVGVLPIPQRNGYTFNGWEDQDGNQVTEYTQITENTEFYARWNRNTYTVYVNPNTGDWHDYNGMLGFQLEYEDKMIVDDPVKLGYSFTGWSVDGAGSYINGKEFTMGYEETILTANYSINNYKLTVNPNGGTWDSFTQSQEYTMTFDTTKTISDPTREGYEFTGWTLTGAGSTLNSSEFKIGYENATLTATWQALSYPYIARHYKQNIGGGDNYTLVEADTEEGMEYFDNQITPAVKTYTGFTSPAAKTITIRTTGNEVDYHYDRFKGTLSVVPNGGKYNNSENITSYSNVYYGETKEITSPSRTCYTFNSWEVTGENSSINGTTFTMGSESTTLSAKWDVIKYSVTFDANGGSVSPGNSQVNCGGTLSSLPTPTRTGYTFKGWFTDATNGNQIITSTAFTSNKTIYAHWQINTYTITYNANGGSVSPTSATVNHGGKLSLPTPSRAATAQYSYTFAGWFTAASGGSQVSNNTQWTSTQTIYAHWTATTRSYTITVNGGTGGGTYAYGSTPTITGTVPGQVVGNWSTPATQVGNVRSRTVTTYSWNRWSDGNTSQSRVITVTGNATYTAAINTSSTTQSQTYSITSIPINVIFSSDAGTIATFSDVYTIQYPPSGNHWLYCYEALYQTFSRVDCANLERSTAHYKFEVKISGNVQSASSWEGVRYGGFAIHGDGYIKESEYNNHKYVMSFSNNFRVKIYDKNKAEVVGGYRHIYQEDYLDNYYIPTHPPFDCPRGFTCQWI